MYTMFTAYFCNHLFTLYYIMFFFFKQKTAYEIRISDWSSDVCSSDLERLEGVATGACSEVEEQIALAHPELIEANGEHQRACSRRMRYCSPVLAAVCFHDQRSMLPCPQRAPIVPRRSGASRAQRLLLARPSCAPGAPHRPLQPPTPNHAGTRTNGGRH